MPNDDFFYFFFIIWVFRLRADDDSFNVFQDFRVEKEEKIEYYYNFSGLVNDFV